MKTTVEWILNNINKGEGVVISDRQRRSYPEVSGYTLTSLFNLGYKKEALGMGLWLSSIQNSDGSFSLGNDKYTFDTQMILGGFQTLGGFHKERKKACEFILSQITPENRFSIQYHDKAVPERILLWGATLLEKEGYDMSKVWDTYFSIPNILVNDCLSHFYCYILDACSESEYVKSNPKYINYVHQAIKDLASIQRPDGSIPAYKTEGWTCYTGVAQAAILFYKIGLIDNGNRAMKFLETIVSTDGGILGSNGSYFPQDKLSWAAKFYIDAYQIMIGKHMDGMFHEFPNDISSDDCRVQYLKKHISPNSLDDANMDVLDIGCCKGRYEKSLPNWGYSYYGIDISDKAIETYNNFGSSFKGTATNIPFYSNTFDCAFSIEVFEHFPYLVENAFREAARVLKFGGKFVLIDKNKSFPCAGREKWEEWFDPEQLANVMRKYFVNVSYEKLDDQFVGWVGYKTNVFEINELDGFLVLDETVSILHTLGITQKCLIQGSALGAYRENGRFCPGDHDIDIVLLGQKTLNEVKSTFVKFGFKLHEEVPNKFLSLIKNNVILDLYCGWVDGMHFITESGANIDKFPKSMFENLLTYKLYNNEFLVPGSIEEYLRLCYGNNWKIPKINTDRDNLVERIWK